MTDSSRRYGSTGRLAGAARKSVDARVGNGAAIANQARENAKRPVPDKHKSRKDK